MNPDSTLETINSSCPISNAELREAIRRRAQQIYEKSGRAPGRDEENWKLAEAEILQEYKISPARKAAIVVAIDGVQYTGEYPLSAADGYMPGEWSAGAPVPIRFEGEKMFLRRRNGKELETLIVKRNQ